MFVEGLRNKEIKKRWKVKQQQGPFNGKDHGISKKVVDKDRSIYRVWKQKGTKKRKRESSITCYFSTTEYKYVLEDYLKESRQQGGSSGTRLIQ